MKSIWRVIIFASVIAIAAGCKDKEANEGTETVLTGRATIAVDESILPIMQDQVQIFEDAYKGKIILSANSESQVVNALLSDSVQIAVLSRNLNEKELEVFKNRKISPKVTNFAIDAITLIAHKSSTDTIIALNDVLRFLKGEKIVGFDGIVFDNLNSSIARQLLEMANVTAESAKNVFSFKTKEEVIKYVAENKGMIGVVGINWILQPSDNMQNYIDNVHILSVKGLKSDQYISPTQNNLAEGTYPLARDLFMINAQGKGGLGMGFASFIAGERGQRIILKSGLLPTRMPGRNLILRKTINVEKK